MNVVVITGVNRGLGKALFDIFAKEDCALIALSRSFTEEQTQLKNQDPTRYFLLYTNLATLDFRDFQAIEQCLQTLSVQSVIFFNNASVIEPLGPIGQLEAGEIDNAIAVNFRAPVKLINFFIGHANRYRRMTIVNISSGAAVRAIDGWAVYCASKAALKMFVDSLKLQFQNNQQLCIENIDPGLIDTQMQAQIREVSGEQFPDVEKFRSYKENHQLQTPQIAAERILKKLNLRCG